MRQRINVPGGFDVRQRGPALPTDQIYRLTPLQSRSRVQPTSRAPAKLRQIAAGCNDSMRQNAFHPFQAWVTPPIVSHSVR